LSLLTASLIPGALFFVCLAWVSVWAAIVAALVWCYGAMTWRAATGRRVSGLLLLGALGLTGRTVLAFATGDTYLYLLQPVITNALVAAAFFLSLATARPVVARLAADFYPMDADVAGRPRVQRLFWHLTLLWAAVCLTKALLTLWLLRSQSVEVFVAARSVVFVLMTLVATVVTVWAAVRVARKEGLLAPAAVQLS
jgi:hypothetical protein